MQNHSQIESFFNSLSLSWQDLIEYLPVGVIFFDENWKIRSINKNFINFFEDRFAYSNLEGVNLFSKNTLSEKLPLKDVLSLRDGKHFEKLIPIRKENSKDLDLIFKGSPIFNKGVFKGGTIIVEDYSLEQPLSTKVLPSSNSITNFLNKICNCFLIVNLDGVIQIVTGDSQSRCVMIKNSEGENLSNLFSSELNLSINNTLNKTIIENESQTMELNYFSDREKITFNSVFIPFVNETNAVNSVVVLLKEKDSVGTDGVSYLSDALKLKEFESFATIAADGLFKINLHGNVTYWAKNAVELFGLTEDEISSNFIGKIFPEITPGYFEDIRKKLLSAGVWEGNLISISEDVNHSFNVKIISKIYDKITDLYVYCNHINKQQQKIILAEEEEKQFFKDAVLKSNQMILQLNPNGVILFSNEQFCKNLDFEFDEIRGVLFTELIKRSFKIKHDISDFESLLNRKELEVLPLVNKSGEIIDVCYNINISTLNTELKYFTVYFKNCSFKDKLFLETAHALLYQFSDPVLIIHEDRIIKVNPMFCQLFGSEFETDFFNLNITNIIDTNSIDSFNKLIGFNNVNNEESEILFKRKDESVFRAKVKIICCSRDSSFSVLILKPVVEEIVIESKSEKIKKLFDKVETYYWSGTYEESELKIDYLDAEFVKSLGYQTQKIKARSKFIEDITHPDDLEKIQFEFGQIFDKKDNTIKEIVYRVINKDGEIVWINNKVKIEVIDEIKINIFGAITDITDWSLEREELKSIINELDKLNTAKEKFISIISHDLKSPFTSIVGFAELILSDASLSKDEIIEFVAHIKEASFHTVDLLNSLLDLTRLQTGRIDVEPKIINANYIAHKTVEILSGLAIQKGLTISTNIDKSFYITADDNLIFQVFNNLVANAIKFTPTGGNINIFAKELPEQQKIEFTIKDTGVGIEKEDLDKLFAFDKKFTTLGTDGEKGTGLGLSLVKEIIDKHKGKIVARSDLGKGTEFIFSLPVSSPSILIVDGIKAERVLYTRLLESITDSIEILQASNEEEGLMIVKEKMPMLVIFEHDLPNMEGDEFIGEIVKAELVYKPSLMVLTKDYSDELSNSYKNIGANDVFNKPFELKDFKTRLDRIIGRVE